MPGGVVWVALSMAIPEMLGDVIGRPGGSIWVVVINLVHNCVGKQGSS